MVAIELRYSSGQQEALYVASKLLDEEIQVMLAHSADIQVR